MLMLIDAGNSRLKWAWCESADTPTSTVSPSKLDDVTAESYSGHDKYRVVNALLSREKPTKLLIVHVLGAIFEKAILQHCKKIGVECEIASTSAHCCGVKNAYGITEDLGADRFVGLVAAHHLFPDYDTIVIDAGTAVTIDAIDSKGQHFGGLIMPGLQLWSDTLIKNTQLQHDSANRDVDVFATSTRKGIDNGSLIGLAGAILHVCQTMEQKLKQPAKRILCGGDSEKLNNYLNSVYNGSVNNNLANNNALSNKDALANKNVQVEFILIPNLVICGLKTIGDIGGKNA